MINKSSFKPVKRLLHKKPLGFCKLDITTGSSRLVHYEIREIISLIITKQIENQIENVIYDKIWYHH